MFFLAASKQGLVKLFFLAVLAALSLGAEAQDDRRKAQFENRLDSVKALSTALSNDPGAARPETKAAIAKVAARQKEAEELAAVGEYDAARIILDEGYGLLTKTLTTLKSGSGYFGPSGAASAAGTGGASRQAASERLLASARSLLDAARRGNGEAEGGRTAYLARIESDIGVAEQACKSGDHVRGEALANNALKELRSLLVSLKGGSSTSVGTAAAVDGGKGKAQLQAAFDKELMGAKGILDALKRQNQEKRAGKDALIEDLETRLRQAETLRGVDISAADQLLDDAYKQTKLALQSINASAAPAAAASGAGSGVAGAESQRAETDRMLKSSALLRDAVARVSKEKGADSSAALTRIDTLSAEARNRQVSDPPRALQAATEANQTAKDALAKLR